MKFTGYMLALLFVVFIGQTLMAQEQFEPTDEHKVLMQEVGTWNAQGKMWMPGSDEPMEFEGVEVNRSIGGMWVVSDFKGNFFGQEFIGHGVLGYDMDGKKYQGTWIDSMSPHSSKMSGNYDKENKTLTLATTTTDPATGNKMKGKNVVVYKDKNTRLMTLYAAMPGQDEMKKNMEITYTRKTTAGSESENK